MALVNNSFTVVRDEIETLDKTSTVRWQMATGALVELGDKEATLVSSGKILKLKVMGPENLQMKTWSTAPTNNYDAENPGTIIVGFECAIPANKKESFEVLMVPSGAENEAQFLDKTLEEW